MENMMKTWLLSLLLLLLFSIGFAQEQQARKLYEQKEYDKCVAFCKRVNKQPGIYLVYAQAMEAVSGQDAALKIYAEGIQRFPAAAQLYYQRGLLYLGRNSTDSAIYDFIKVLNVAPRHAGANLFLGSAVSGRNYGPALMAISASLIVSPGGDMAETGRYLLAELMNNEVPTPKTLETHMQVLTIDNGDAGFFTRHYVPFYTEMKRLNYFETASHVILADSAWMSLHTAQVQAFEQWVRAYQWPSYT